MYRIFDTIEGDKNTFYLEFQQEIGDGRPRDVHLGRFRSQGRRGLAAVHRPGRWIGARGSGRASHLGRLCQMNRGGGGGLGSMAWPLWLGMFFMFGCRDHMFSEPLSRLFFLSSVFQWQPPFIVSSGSARLLLPSRLASVARQHGKVLSGRGRSRQRLCLPTPQPGCTRKRFAMVVCGGVPRRQPISPQAEAEH